MKRKTLSQLYIISFFVLIISVVITGVYHIAIKENHEGMMESWAIALLCCSFTPFVILHIVVNHFHIKLADGFGGKNAEKAERVTDAIFAVIFTVISLPLILIFLIFKLITLPFTGEKSQLRPLIRKGFKYSRVGSEKRHMLTRDEVIIKISYGMTEWSISLDGGRSFVKLTDSEVGTEYERQALEELMLGYESAHPVDKQRGDAIPPTAEYVKFLCQYL